MSEKMGDEITAGGARRTPYELVFTEGDFESRVFPLIRDEAASAGHPVVGLGRDTFDFIRAAGEVVREVTPRDSPPEALEQYRALLFHAFHFWHGGHRLYTLETPVARYLVESRPDLENWQLALPARSFYLQIPANLFWSSISPDDPPEPVDGIFVTETEQFDSKGATLQHVDLLMVLGVRKARSGFSVIPLESAFGTGIPVPWNEGERSSGDFANDLPGGEIAGLYSILTVAEVFKLFARSCWYTGAFPEHLIDVPATAHPSDERASSSRLSYSRITLNGGDGEG